jgi:hypothetical protein
VAQPDPAKRQIVEAAILEAFAGVRLGGGVSLVEAEAIDGYYERMSLAEAHRLRQFEITDDWSALTPSDLDSENLAHLDAEGLRYYLPAFMLRLLDDYQPGEMWCIGTIASLDQRRPYPLDFMEMLTDAQRTAIAAYVEALPELVALDHEDAAVIDRSLAQVWRTYTDQRAT